MYIKLKLELNLLLIGQLFGQLLGISSNIWYI